MKTTAIILPLVAALGLMAGCGTSYAWRPSVPEAQRTVSVPTFRNESDVAELGAVATRQLLREFQREGTFSIRASGDAVIEIQGVIKAATAGVTGYDRRSGMRAGAYEFIAVADVSVVDKPAGKVLVNNRQYTARANFSAAQDRTTARRDASGRAMEDLARQVVDDVLGLKW